MLQYDFEQSPGFWLAVASHAYYRAINEELAPFGLTFRQSQVLGWLVLEGELSQAELAGKMMVEPPTLVGMLDRMERSGWLSRHRCCQDRRKKMIRLNPAAESVWETIVACARRVRSRATQGMSDQELVSLRRLLHQMSQNLEPATKLSEPAAKPTGPVAKLTEPAR